MELPSWPRRRSPSRLAGGWVAITDGLISGVGGSTDPMPDAERIIRRRRLPRHPGPGQHPPPPVPEPHRAYPPMTSAPLVRVAAIALPAVDRRSTRGRVPRRLGRARRTALSGCTTSSDHHYSPPGSGGRPARRGDPGRSRSRHALPQTCASMSVGESDSLPTTPCGTKTTSSPNPNGRWNAITTAATAMVRVALAPCSPFSVSEDLMIRSAELPNASTAACTPTLPRTARTTSTPSPPSACGPSTTTSTVAGCRIAVGVLTSSCRTRTKCPARRCGVGIAHCPSSNMILSSGIAPVVDLRHAGCHVGLGCDGSSSADSASLWQEARLAMLQGKLKSGADAMDARTALEISTRGGAGCLGRIGEIGELSVGAVGDMPSGNSTARSSRACSTTSSRAGCEPAPTRPGTVVAGRLVVESGCSSHRISTKLAAHAAAARRFNRPTESSVLARLLAAFVSRGVVRRSGSPEGYRRRMPVKTERHGGVLVVQLDRDEKRNAINGEMTESISAALDAGEDDPAVRAIVIAGGPTVFCAGTDIAEGSGTPTDQGGEYGIIRRRSTTRSSPRRRFRLRRRLRIALACHLSRGVLVGHLRTARVRRGLVATSAGLFRRLGRCP